MTQQQQQHPITPPPHLIEQWMQDHSTKYALSRQAARWGADQELEACCEVLARELICDGKHVATDLRMIRRPKSPNLKERALIHFESFAAAFETSGGDSDLIRCALEQLPDHE